MKNDLLIEENRLLKNLCTFGIGGPARFFVEVKTVTEMQMAIQWANEKNIPYFILGKGSNCLFHDLGFDGLVIHNRIEFLNTPTPGIFHVGAGYSFSLLGAQTARNHFSGLEFASGIPASVGGAIFMNAGANGKETCDTLLSVEYVDEGGAVLHLAKEALQFSYRTSSFQSMKGAIVGATFALTASTNAKSKQLEIINYRKKTQPYGDKSAGCIFANPTSNFAGRVIEQAGLKGNKVGGAKVSEMHANFIVNDDKATCQDVLHLIEIVKQTVKETSHIDLESEVRVIPYILREKV